jgi:hypothetical protein
MINGLRHEPSIARTKILKDAFPRVSATQACALVGVLFERRFILAVEIENPTLHRKTKHEFVLEPLEPPAASLLVATAIGLDCDELFLQFQRRWGALRDSVETKGILAQLQSHPWVERLERVAEFE